MTIKAWKSYDLAIEYQGHPLRPLVFWHLQKPINRYVHWDAHLTLGWWIFRARKVHARCQACGL